MVEVTRVDYHNPSQCDALITLLQSYAQDPMGGGEALSTQVTENLINALQKRNHLCSFICYVDGVPAGFANCIESFSTFNCKPILNIHDFAVNAEFRGLGLSQALMDGIEKHAKSIDCCKVTLEVLEGNEPAKQAYIKAGFNAYELDPKMGKAMFWEKKLKG